GRGRGCGARGRHQHRRSLSALHAFGGGIPLLAALDRPPWSAWSADHPSAGLPRGRADPRRRDPDRLSRTALSFYALSLLDLLASLRLDLRRDPSQRRRLLLWSHAT